MVGHSKRHQYGVLLQHPRRRPSNRRQLHRQACSLARRLHQQWRRRHLCRFLATRLQRRQGRRRAQYLRLELLAEASAHLRREAGASARQCRRGARVEALRSGRAAWVGDERQVWSKGY